MALTACQRHILANALLLTIYLPQSLFVNTTCPTDYVVRRPDYPPIRKSHPTPRPRPRPHPTVAGSPDCQCNNCWYGCWLGYEKYLKWGSQYRDMEFGRSRRPRATNGNKLEDNQAQFGEFPWMVAVFGPNNLFIAGGTLIDPKVVLTAAHKVYKYRNVNLTARLGDWDIATPYEHIPSQDISVKEIWYHPEFNHSTLINNLALVILQKDVIVGETVMPICPTVTLPSSQSCLVIGWDENVLKENGRYEQIMKKVPITAVSHSTCQSMLRKNKFGPDFNLHWSFHCAVGQGEPDSVCGINDGSPLICPSSGNPDMYVQAGALSWSEDCGIAGIPIVFAHVPYRFVSQIQQNIAGGLFDDDFVWFRI